MATKKKTTSKKYRILKTIRSETAPLGVDYTPEYKENGKWIVCNPAVYSYNDAVQYLQLIKARHEVKTEYIYPEL